MPYCQTGELETEVWQRGQAGAGLVTCLLLPNTGAFNLLEFLPLRWQPVLMTRKVTFGAPQNYEN